MNKLLTTTALIMSATMSMATQALDIGDALQLDQDTYNESVAISASHPPVIAGLQASVNHHNGIRSDCATNPHADNLQTALDYFEQFNFDLDGYENSYDSALWPSAYQFKLDYKAGTSQNVVDEANRLFNRAWFSDIVRVCDTVDDRMGNNEEILDRVSTEYNEAIAYVDLVEHNHNHHASFKMDSFAELVELEQYDLIQQDIEWIQDNLWAINGDVAARLQWWIDNPMGESEESMNAEEVAEAAFNVFEDESHETVFVPDLLPGYGSAPTLGAAQD